jgi:PAS domain S-box-containing protein
MSWRKLPTAVIGLLLVFPLLNLLGWFTGNILLIQIRPGWAPLVPNAAFLFILCGFSLACWMSALNRLGMACAILVSVFAASVGMEYLLKREFAIDGLLFDAYPPYMSTLPGRFSPNAALCFLLSSIALALMNSRAFAKATYAVGLLGSVVSALGAMGLLGYVFNVAAAYGWGVQTGMSMFSCLAFLLLGLAISVCAWKSNEAAAGQPNIRFMAICLALGIISATTVFWRALLIQEQKQVKRTLASEMDILQSELGSGTRNGLNALERMGQRWEFTGPPGKPQWENEARLNLRDFEGYEAIAWADSGLTIRWAAHAGDYGHLEGKPAAPDPEAAQALGRAVGSGTMQVTGSIRLPDGGTGFIAYQPIVKGARIDGVMVGIFRYRDLFMDIMPTSTLQEYTVAIYEGGRRIFPEIDPLPMGEGRWTKVEALKLRNATWELRVRPTPELLSEQLSSLPHIVLLGGILIACLMAAAMIYGQRSVQHAARLQVANLELERSRESFANIVEKNADGIIVCNHDGTVRFANASAAALLGRRREEMAGSRLPFSLEKGRVNELRLDRPDGGTPIVLEISVMKTDWEGDTACLASLRDITDSVRIREALLRSESKLRRLVDSNIVGVFVADAQGVIREANDAVLNILGYERADLDAGKINWLDLTPPEFMHVIEKAVEEMEATGASKAYEKTCIRKDGRLTWTIVAGVDLGKDEGIIAFMLDIDMRKTAEEALRRNEEQMRQSQKMEAVGRLAGGVAHDFNNLLTAINGYSDILLDSMDAGDPNRPAIEEIKKAGEKAAALTKQMLAFSRKQVVVPKVLDANSVVADMLNLIRRLIGENMELEVVLEPEAGRFKADFALVQQVILNLALNARDAMPHGGRLSIVTGSESIRDDAGMRKDGSGFHLKAVAGHYVTFAVRDTGMGMDEGVLSHLFEPFFSTKEKGKGTGLGLSTVYGVVKQFHGAIKVDSRIGEGTTFTIFLPRVETEAKAEPPRPESRKGPDAGQDRGRERILLVEDEEGVRKMARAILEEKGYSVATAADGREALAWFRDHEGEADLLLTDIVMPGMNGRELAGIVRGLKPDIRVVFISGYTEDDAVLKDLDAGSAFQAKPFTPEALTRIVRSTLDASAPVGQREG